MFSKAFFLRVIQKLGLCGQDLTFSQTKNLDSSKLKEFADDNFKLDENGIKLSKRVENTVGKEEIIHYEQFLLFLSLFPTVFSKGLYCRHVKTRACLGKG